MRYKAVMLFFKAVIGLFCIFIGFSNIDRVFAENQSSSDYEVYINMAIIASIESSNNPKAYNKRTKAAGLYQITPICLADYNNYHSNKYSDYMLFDSNVNYIIANWYMNKRIPQLLKYYGVKDNIKSRLWAYNAGIGKVVKNVMPKETIDYISKYYAGLSNKSK